MDIRLVGVALVDEPGWVSVVDGFVSNVNGHAPTVSYESNAVQHRVSTAKAYEAYGARLAASTTSYLDERVDEGASTIDIVNAFLTAIRRTSLTAPLDSVGKAATASVIPLQLLADAAGRVSWHSPLGTTPSWPRASCRSHMSRQISRA